MVSELCGRVSLLGAGSKANAAVQQLCGMMQHGRGSRAMEHGKAHLVTTDERRRARSTVLAVAGLGPGSSGRGEVAGDRDDAASESCFGRLQVMLRPPPSHASATS